MDVFRVGRISSVNYDAGTARVTYEDRDDATTSEMPLLSPFMIYWMPKVGDPVCVLHLPNGQEMGLILGRYWCAENPPNESGEGLYRHDMERGQNCFIRHTEGGLLEIYAPNGIEITGDTKIIGNTEITKNTTIQQNATIQMNTTVNGLTTCNAGLAAQGGSMGGAQITGNLKTTGAMQAQGDVTAGGISLQGHTHTAPSGETSAAH